MQDQNTNAIKFFTDDQIPGPSKKKGKYAAFFDELRNNPGLWAEYPAQGPAIRTVGSSIKKGAVVGSAPAGSFDATVRLGVLYVRFIDGVA